MQGGVIGINSAIVSPSGGSVGIGFAIPSNNARKIVAALLAHGAIPRGWLGISVEDIPTTLQGAKITGLEPDGPAYKAGLTDSDIVLAVDGAPITGSSALIRAIASMSPGTKVTLQIKRGGHIYDQPVVIDRRPAQVGG